MAMRRESLRLFQNEFLEKFSHVHPMTPLIVWSPVVFAFLWRSFVVDQLGILAVLSLGVSGFLVWTLSEYLLHRFIFHYDAKGTFQHRVQFIIHGNHHDVPDDPTRLVMPPAVAIFLAVIFYSLFRFVLGKEWADPFFAFFIVGYLCYDYIHYYVHHFNPTTRVGRFLKQSHMLHHFATPEARWGVSSPLWDYVFGTTGREKKPAGTQGQQTAV